MSSGVLYCFENNDNRIYFHNPKATLPVMTKSKNIIRLPWGRRKQQQGTLPLGGWARLEAIYKGQWDRWQPQPVKKIPAKSFMEKSYDGMNHWFDLVKGQCLQGLVARYKYEQRVYIVTIEPEQENAWYHQWPRIINQGIHAMCGRFSLDRLPDNIVEALIDAEIAFTPREQIYPSENVQVVFRSENGNELAQMKWGWERSFAKRPLINARANEAWSKPTWKEAIKYRRCIIPASAYYEWDENQPQGKRDCYRIEPTLGDGFALGGLYEISQQTGEMFMSILTTGPNSKMAKIHHRMPVIVEEDRFDAWLESEAQAEISSMFKPLDSNQIEMHKQ